MGSFAPGFGLPALFVLVFCSFVFLTGPVTAQGRVQVFSAASLEDVMEQIGAAFTHRTGIEVVVVSAGSSTLAQQIAAGAPADVFVSANRDWISFVVQRAGFGSGVELFSNRLVVAGTLQFPGKLETLEDLPGALAGRRLALGEPEHVPAGIYARQALESAGIWEDVKDLLAPSANVRAALRLVEAGAAPFGIVYLTDTRNARVRVVLEIDPALHEPIAYMASPGPDANGDVVAFFDFLLGEKAREIAYLYGYGPVAGD